MTASNFTTNCPFLKGGNRLLLPSHHVQRDLRGEITKPELGCGLEACFGSARMPSRLTRDFERHREAGTRGPAPVGATIRRRRLARQLQLDYIRRHRPCGVASTDFWAGRAPCFTREGIDLVLSCRGRDHRNPAADHRDRQRRPRIRPCRWSSGVAAGRTPLGVTIGFHDRPARRNLCRQRFHADAVRFEPCGLSQMYAPRFGSLLRSATRPGGLAENHQ